MPIKSAKNNAAFDYNADDQKQRNPPQSVQAKNRRSSKLQMLKHMYSPKQNMPIALSSPMAAVYGHGFQGQFSGQSSDNSADQQATLLLTDLDFFEMEI